MRGFGIVLACVVAGLPGRVVAQAVQGRVVRGAGAPVPGAVVTAFDGGGTPLAAALADDSGRFTVRFPGAGAVQLRVSRVGYALSFDSLLALSDGRVVDRTVVASGAPVVVAGEEREASACIAPGAPTVARTVWDQARIALIATELTRLTREYTEDVDVIARREPADRTQPTSNDRRVITGTPVRALSSVPAEELAASGYLSRDATGDRYQAPHEDVLLSESFAATHCLRLMPYDAGATTLRVGFEPGSGRPVPDVRGTVTLDRATLALRRVDFTYTNLAQAGRAGEVTGEIVYRRLPDATWIAASWLLTQSVDQQYVRPRPLVAGRFGAPPPARPEIINGTSRVITGGHVLRVRSRAATIWAAEDAPAETAP